MSKTRPRLFIGPWIGEFGVEVLRWQGIARAVARSRRWQEVIVCSQPGRELLYRDFATRFVSCQAASEHTVGFGCRGDARDEVHRHFIDVEQGDVHLSPRLPELQKRIFYGMAAARSDYRNFAQDVPAPSRPYDILIHARATLKADQSHKNWPVEFWERLIAELPAGLRVASIGARNGAHKIKGTADLRDVPLEKLAGYCGAARLMIGPSSGPMHFAMHCGLHTITWVDRDPHHEARLDARCNYHPVWNPWNVHLCCLLGWQPTPSLISYKVKEMLELIATDEQPIKYAVVGTKRSGHHAVLEWLTQLSPSSRFTHWNDCVCEGMETFPFAEYIHPTRQMLPKMLQCAKETPSVFHWNQGGAHPARIVSFEGTPIEKFRRIPEVRSAKRLVFVLRDGPNLAASLRRGIPELSRMRFLAPQFLEIMRIYRGYLLEAVGKTNHLGSLRKKTVFISYNRWHMEEDYRRAIAKQLTGEASALSRGLQTAHSHPSGFQPLSTSATDLKTLSRWKHFANDDGFWNLACDAAYFEAERAFHGPYYLIGQPPPMHVGSKSYDIPVWAS